MLEVFGKDKRYGELKPLVLGQKKKGESVSMCALLDYAINQGIEKGIEEGIEKGIIKERNAMALEMLRAGEPAHSPPG